MSAKRKSNKTRIASKKPAVARSKKLQPDVPVAVLAGLGLLVTGYLAWTSGIGGSPAFCAEGSGCDVVQSSRYSTLFGLPVALWGFGLYALIAWTATTLPPRVTRWRRLAWLSTLGLAISLYLTVTGWIALDAWCAWCMTSQVIMLVLFGLVMLKRPESAPGMPPLVFARNLVIVTGVSVAALGAWQNGLLQPPENPRLKALAEHLEATGARYYGAFWCPSCQDQRRLFGRSADRLPYVECSPNGRQGVVAFACVSADISGYPTWIINGRRYQQVLSPDELARYSGFEYAKDDA